MVRYLGEVEGLRVIVEPTMYDECRSSRQVEGPYLHTFLPGEADRWARRGGRGGCMSDMAHQLSAAISGLAPPRAPEHGRGQQAGLSAEARCAVRGLEARRGAAKRARGLGDRLHLAPRRDLAACAGGAARELADCA